MSETTIIIRKETRNALKELGLKGETYDQIIEKLIRLRTNRPEIRKQPSLQTDNP